MSEPNRNRTGANRPPQTQQTKASPPQTPGKGPASQREAGYPSGPVPNLFRRIDWITAGLTTFLVLVGYVLTLAPQVTLEDSGELAVGSFYAGVPHPPGYPVWTIYTWLFTVLFPFSNVAYRVAMSSAVAAAASCGIISLIVSRGSSMMIESISDLKNLDKRTENGLCMLAGWVAGTMLGFNGYMWSQAVIVEVYTFSVLSLALVLVTLLRWIYAPHQRRYLWWCAFWFGICATNHQTLIVAAMGIEVAVLAGSIALGRDLFAVNSIVWGLGLLVMAKGGLTGLSENKAILYVYHMVGLGSLAVTVVTWWKTLKLFTEWKTILMMGIMWTVGVSFYFYMPITSMTNPPMNWGYPRTEEGFWHALTRGQYDKTQPTNDVGKFVSQAAMYFEGATEEFTWVYLFIPLIPWFYFGKMQKRERAWMIGVASIYFFLSVLLMYLLNPNTDRQAKEQARVFFTASHVMLAMGIGYGMALIGASLKLQYAKHRMTAIVCAAVGCAIFLYRLVALKSLFKLDQYNATIALMLTAAALLLFLFHRADEEEEPRVKPPSLPGSGPEPIVAATMMKRSFPVAILIGIFALTPVNAILGHWADNEQRGHIFGYWFGHDMFTPPFKLYPEMTKNAILFGGTDPGRFNPTYMIFCESFIPAEKRTDPNFDRRDVYLITQNALADATYLNYIRAHYNRSAENDPPFFVNFLRSQKEEEEGRTNFVAKMFVPVDRFFTDFGAKVEARRRKEGVYPPKEIITPTPADSSMAFSNYISDAQLRLQHDMQFPNEPKRIRVGEDVKIVDNKISVQGQVAVMAINGLLTKTIFDANPTNEFFVEESFPLDWMFPYLTPYGIIMKINRKEVPEFTEDMMVKDHEFWSQYSDRFIGNWITYDTPIDKICEFAERVYLRRDFKGFKGSPMFVRDDNAQKAFSKLRSAIGGLYSWRLGRPKSPAEQTRLQREAEFALKQSFAFCPYSPEAVFKLVTLLVNVGRADEAEKVVETCVKFDPENMSMQGLLANIQEIKKGFAAQSGLQSAENEYRTNPANLQSAFKLASMYLALQRTNDAYTIFDHLVTRSNVDENTLLSVATAYSQLGNMTGLEGTLSKFVKLRPDNPEAWYDLSRAQAVTRKIPEALRSLETAVGLSNKRLATNAASKNIAVEAQKEQAFGAIRQLPEFQKLVNPQQP